MKKVTLCADDFAMHPAIDQAVLALAQMGRLHATSCMTTAPRWSHAAAMLRPLAGSLQTGLHFNLTEGHGTSTAPGLKQVLIQAYTGRMRSGLMQEAFNRQLDAFEAQMQRAPDFIDGHQHVHQLPGARAALMVVLEQRYGQHKPWIRSTAPARGLRFQSKAAIIALLGGWRLQSLLRQQQLPHNHGFGGVYGFDAATPQAYGEHMAQWLAQAMDGTLIMCHPAASEVHGDAIGQQRPIEYAYLRSAEFGQLLARQQVQLGPLSPQTATA